MFLGFLNSITYITTLKGTAIHYICISVSIMQLVYFINIYFG